MMPEVSSSSKNGTPRGASRDERLGEKLDEALDTLSSAKPFARGVYQNAVFQLAEAMMATEDGLRALYERAHLFDESAVFVGGPWVDPSKLQPPLVAGSLRAGGIYPVVETLSELRMLAIAKGRTDPSNLEQWEATEYLNETMALNLELLFPGDTEAERIEGGPHRESNIRLFRLIASEIGPGSLKEDVVSEIEQICAQRPIMIKRVTRMVDMASRIPKTDGLDRYDARLEVFRRAFAGPTPLTESKPSPAEYRRMIEEADPEVLTGEARAFAAAVNDTGLVCPAHAVLLRRLRKLDPSLVGEALGVNAVGQAALDEHWELVSRLIKVAVLPTTAQCIYGLARALERGVFSRQAVTAGLQRIIELDLQSSVRRELLARRQGYDGVTANSILLAGVLSVIGQPLGIGQGRNPTCQAARGMSMWAQHQPGYLFDLLISAARDGLVEMQFEGEWLRSNELSGGLMSRIDHDLDTVSIVLVPHLDRLYDEMMRRVGVRDDDGHKWVNPALYGRQVPNGFASVFQDRAQTTVAAYEDFVRRFYATHHPSYTDVHELMHPNPVGICVTNSHSSYLGPHAVTLLRVAEDPDGVLRAYFFNPNNEGRQDWGDGIRPSIREHGEIEGESSLPFHEFTSRLYAFHYNPYEEGDSYAVPQDTIAEISKLARESWGKAFVWKD